MNTIKHAAIMATLLVSSSVCQASSPAPGITWYDSLDKAQQASKEYGKKFIFMVAGTETCPRTKQFRFEICEDKTNRPLIDNYFIMWFCDASKSSEWLKYTDEIGGIPVRVIMATNNLKSPLYSTSVYDNVQWPSLNDNIKILNNALKKAITSGGCLTTLSTNYIAFNSEGGKGSFNIKTTSKNCTWNIENANKVDWITFDSTNGTGNATVSFTIANNDNSYNRMKIVYVNGIPLNIFQKEYTDDGSWLLSLVPKITKKKHKAVNQ